jgi:hypothetical protein
MLSKEGHIKIIDFGTAKDFLDPQFNGSQVRLCIFIFTFYVKS